MSEDSRPNNKSDIRISSHDVAVQILSRLDEHSYKEAIEEDAVTINENYLLSFSFPWRQVSRLPKKALKAMPRDIDELHVITHCDGNLHAPFGDFNGPLGFGKLLFTNTAFREQTHLISSLNSGRYENSQSRGHYGTKTSFEESAVLPIGPNPTAAARRSRDPGVIELAVQLPLPPTMGPNELTADKWKEDLIWGDRQDAELLSYMPYRWDKRNDAASKPYAHSGQSLTTASTTSHATTPTNALSYEKAKEHQSKSKAQRDFSMSCISRWRVSAKVDGVSTRSSLFPPSTKVGYTKDKSEHKVIRPMLNGAILPEEVEIGQTVSMERAAELDNEGLAHRLGSYDCRLLDPKKDPASRSKKVEVGRTRLVWSNLNQGDEPYAPSTQNRIAYNSLITGRRLEPSKTRRPREVRVGVRIEGKLIVEETTEEIVHTTNSRKRKHSTRQASESELQENKPSIECPEERTDQEIDDAFAFSLATQENTVGRSLFDTANTRENGSVIHIDIGSMSNYPSQIDRRAIIAYILKFNKHKKIKQSTIQNAPSHSLKSTVPPRFAMLPLEDRILRSVCMTSGKLLGSPVHQLLRDASQQESRKKCSVCWSDEGEGQDSVQECSSCGLFAHRSCCQEKGQFITVSNEPPVQPNKTPEGSKNTNGASNHCQLWECAVCCQYAEKPRRIARVPSRFKDDDGEDASTPSSNSSITAASKNEPGPRCSLCPHRGGAMSQNNGSQQWAHEVCRIWSNADIPESNESFDSYPKFLSSACALCGGGGVKKGKSATSYYTGLTKCAARGCYVAFHPMCALISSRINFGDQGNSASTSERQNSTEQAIEEKKSDEDDEHITADKKLCNKYTLQLVKLTQTEGTCSQTNSQAAKSTIIPVAFCGLHNPNRESAFYGRPPGGGFTEE